MDLELSAFVAREENENSLLRFDDTTDPNSPRLRYSVPLPGAIRGKFYMEMDYFNSDLPWTNAAFADNRVTPAITDFAADLEARPGRPEPSEPPPFLAFTNLVVVPRNDRHDSARSNTELRMVARKPPAQPPNHRPTDFTATATETSEALGYDLEFENLTVPFQTVVEQARHGRAPVFSRSFGGTLELNFVSEAQSQEEANPRFMIIDHYQMSSFFGDYGAGKTLGVFSLLPGEETKLYLRTWRRTEQTLKQASSIFDSTTEESSNEFEYDMQREISETDSETQKKNKSRHSKYAGSGEVEIGIKRLGKVKTSHNGELINDKSVETTKARETVAKNTAKVAASHAARASSKRDMEVTQELEINAQSEFERITERVIKNTNLSRTLNITTRELNQEFSTYMSLVDVTLAFTNDMGIFEVFQIHELDAMLEKYIRNVETSTGSLVDASSPFGAQTPRDYVRRAILRQINQVVDFRGTKHAFVEECVTDGDREQLFNVGEAPLGADSYLRIRRSRDGSNSNPFYEDGDVPVEGIVINLSTHTLRTPAVVLDSLLGHGVALDNYALGMQQEALREKQLDNRKTEMALDLIANGDASALENFRALFGSVDSTLLRDLVLGQED